MPAAAGAKSGEQTGFLAQAGAAARSARRRGLLFASPCRHRPSPSPALPPRVLGAALQGGHPGTRCHVPAGLCAEQPPPHPPGCRLLAERGDCSPPGGGGGRLRRCVWPGCRLRGRLWPPARPRALCQRRPPVGTAWPPASRQPCCLGRGRMRAAAPRAAATAVASLRSSAPPWALLHPQKPGQAWRGLRRGQKSRRGGTRGGFIPARAMRQR